MKNTDREFINDRAKSKTDGVYSIRGIVYRVVDGYATHYATGGQILLNSGSVVVEVGKFVYMDEAKKMLKARKG